jgi:hypothetical protein
MTARVLQVTVPSPIQFSAGIVVNWDFNGLYTDADFLVQVHYARDPDTPFQASCQFVQQDQVCVCVWGGGACVWVDVQVRTPMRTQVWCILSVSVSRMGSDCA